MHKDETEEEFGGEANALRDDVNRYRSFTETLHLRYGYEQSKLEKELCNWWIRNQFLQLRISHCPQAHDELGPQVVPLVKIKIRWKNPFEHKCMNLSFSLFLGNAFSCLATDRPEALHCSLEHTEVHDASTYRTMQFLQDGPTHHKQSSVRREHMGTSSALSYSWKGVPS